MVPFAWSPAAGMSCLAEVLWHQLRILADDGLARRATADGAAQDNRIRGEIYLFIMDVITQQIDRLDHESAPERHRMLESALETVWPGTMNAARRP
jgi:hypothetical protein